MVTPRPGAFRPPPPPVNPMTPRVWYIVAGGLFVIAIAMALTGFAQAKSTVEELRRFAMPGRAEIVLPAGPSTLYAEHRSLIDGKALEAPEGLAVQCRMSDLAGKLVPLAPSGSGESYRFGGYAGHSAFDLRTEESGTYVLSCEAPSPFAVAIGYGVGTWSAVAAVGGLVPGAIGAIMILVVMARRSRQKRRAAASAG
jgi:hypothetical protein